MRKDILTVCYAMIVDFILFIFLVYIGKQYVMSATLCLLSILAFVIFITFLFRDETKRNCMKKAVIYFVCAFFVNLVIILVHSKVSREMGYGHALYVITLFVFFFIANLIGTSAAFVFTHLKPHTPRKHQ